MTSRFFAPAFDAGVLTLGVLLAIATAALISVPELSAVKLPLVCGIVLVTMLLVPPTEFLVASLLFFALLQLVADRAYSVGPANVFLSDLFLGIVTLRAVSPRDRVSTPRRLGALTLGAFAVWAALMFVGMARGVSHGAPFDVVVRYASPLFYWSALYFGFSRVLRERGIDFDRLVRLIVSIGLALIAYMFLMRLLNRPFESLDQTRGHLGAVVASTGRVFHRDFGFWSAYIVYPIVALIATGKLLYSRRHELAWLTVAVVSIVATLTTLIRSEIYGLIAGLAVVFLLSKDALAHRTGRGSSRATSVLMIASSVLAVGALLAAVNPGLAEVIGERSIPYRTEQSAAAQENAQYRLNALEAGLSVAGDHAAGLGIVSPSQLQDRRIDPEFLAHSGPATLLIFLGWPGLIAAVLVLLGLIIDSSRVRFQDSWHPVFVGILVLLVVNSFGAVGIVGQEYVMGIAALVIALRFAAVDPRRAE